MKRRIRIILEYLSAFVLITLLLLAITGVVVVKFYGDDLQTYVMEQVNNRLDSKVNIEEVSIRVFHKFPNISIVLRDITIWSSHNFNTRDFVGTGADTLLTAEKVSVSFNLFGLIRKKYNIRQLEIIGGTLHLFTDRDGEVNYKMRSNNQREKGDYQQINLSQLRVDDFHILLNNQAKQLKSSGLLKRLDLNGRFSKRNTQIKGSLVGFLEEISNKEILYASNRDIRAKLNLNVNDSLYTIKAGQLQIDRIVADVDGTFQVNQGDGVLLDLYAAARDLEIHEVLDLLPSEMSNPLQEIRGNGILQLYARVTGVSSATLTPQVEADFQTSNANLQWNKFPFSVKNLNLSGTYSNGGEFNPVTTSLIIESISAAIGKDRLAGRGRIHNFLDPEFQFELKGDIHPKQWIQWYESIPLHQVKGTVISDINVSGSYDRLKPPGEKFLEFDVSGELSLEEVMVRITKEGTPFSALNGTVSIDNDFWEPSLTGIFGGSDFSVTGSGLNLLSFLLDRDEDLVASATFRSNRLDLQEVLDNLSGKESGKTASVHFPDNLNLKLDFIINEFRKERFEANNMRGIAQYDAPFFYIDSLIMQTMEGTLRGSVGMLQDSNGEIFTNVNATLHTLNIHQLFYAFNSFGQTQITHEHLKGSISGTSVFSAEFDTTFTIHPQTILSENELTIHDGELNGFSPIMALSRFIEVEELQNIKFETLENTILIRDNQVIIPAMDIQSNALNLSASGTHGFDNHYDYRLRLKLSDLLYNKARSSKNTEFIIAEDESDRRILFLKIYSEGSGANVELDREKTAQKIRNDLKNEKTELKEILNQELGLFKRDETIIQEKNQQEEREETFRFEFTDEPDSITVTEKKREKGRWWKNRSKKDTVQNKPARDFVIDE
ncbi:MAG: AsmA-like C-terminal region-containing protein [Bacteroidota bacterium]